MSKASNRQRLAVFNIWLAELKANVKRPKRRVIVDLDDE
jgi:hypothetical protein